MVICGADHWHTAAKRANSSACAAPVASMRAASSGRASWGESWAKGEGLSQLTLTLTLALALALTLTKHLVQSRDDLSRRSDVTAGREQPQPPALEHVASDHERARGEGAQVAVVSPRAGRGLGSGLGLRLVARVSVGGNKRSSPAEKVRDGPVSRTVEEQPDRALGLRVMLQHEHHAAVQVRLLDEERVRLSEEDAALLRHRKLVDPPFVAGGLGRSGLEVNV